jgi:hypothetical protein
MGHLDHVPLPFGRCEVLVQLRRAGGWDALGHVLGQLWRPARRVTASRTGLLR